ncbi:MAG: sulfotransferase [Pseudomonadota bacterium]
MRESNAVFLGGDARSGTTLLIDLIGLHPQISAIYETNFLIRIVRLLTKYGWTSRVHGPKRIHDIMQDACEFYPTSRLTEIRGTRERFLHGPNHVLLEPEFVMKQTEKLERSLRWGNHDEALNSFILDLFAEHCRAESKPRWVNKTPRNINVLPRLYAAMPGMRFIHSIRDGRDVVCSNMRRGSRNMAEGAASWIEIARLGQAYAQTYGDSFLEVRYESLLQDPQKELDRIFAWLGEEACGDKVLQQYEAAGFRVNASRIGGWKQELSDQDQREFDKIAGDLIDSMGYRDA